MIELKGGKMNTFNFRTDLGQSVQFNGNRYDMIRVVDWVKESEFINNTEGTVGCGIIDLYIKTKNNKVFIKVYR